MSDKQTIEGYLAGKAEAMAAVECLLDAAFSTWRARLGTEERFIRADVHFKLYQLLKRGEFRQRSSLRTYVSSIAAHTCIDYLRFNQRFAPEDIGNFRFESTAAAPDELLERKELGWLLFRVMRRLPKSCIRLWRMQLNDGLTCREIGERLGKTEGNIRRRLWECRQKAKEIRAKLLKTTNVYRRETPMK